MNTKETREDAEKDRFTPKIFRKKKRKVNEGVKEQRSMLHHQNMNRKGRVVEISALILILVTSLGIFKIFSEAEHIYVGDKTTNIFYDYKLCPEAVKKIAKENTIIFDTREEARKLFKEAEGCVKNE